MNIKDMAGTLILNLGSAILINMISCFALNVSYLHILLLAIFFTMTFYSYKITAKTHFKTGYHLIFHYHTFSVNKKQIIRIPQTTFL